MNINKIMIAALLSFTISISGMNSENNGRDMSCKFEKTMPTELIVRIINFADHANFDSMIKSVKNRELRFRLEQNKNDWEEINLFEAAEAFAGNNLLNLCKILNVDLSKIKDHNLVKIENHDKPVTDKLESLAAVIPEVSIQRFDKAIKTAWLCKILGMPILPKDLSEQELKEHIDSLLRLFP